MPNKTKYNIVNNKKNTVISMFSISRTAVDSEELIAVRNSDRLKTYQDSYKNIKNDTTTLMDNFEKLDQETLDITERSRNMDDYQKDMSTLGYGNCTTQSICLVNELDKCEIEARLLKVTNHHHVVIAKGIDNFNLIISDPWADIQFEVNLEDGIECLDSGLSRKDLFCIIKEIANHYPELKEFPDRNKHLIFNPKNTIIESTFGIEHPNEYLTKITTPVKHYGHKSKQPMSIMFDNYSYNSENESGCVIC
ncbi:hypothetical protein L3V82_12925 [Thiotrichales bacterium 19S3-7]|nr:hypothetical protein [Thiotrichales bacterium 19S3-7]MCF6803076.1 hypothetical protein [Thiotrichales bacterium 19S3-11]